MKRAFVLCLLAGTASSVALANDIEWASPVNGLWNTDSNWSPATVPSGAADVAILGLSGPYTVQMNLSPTISGVSILNPDAVLEISFGRTLTLGAGGLFNDGWIIINPTSTASTTSLALNAPFTLDGFGTLSLNRATTGARIISGTDALLTHGVDHTINGFGLIEIRFDNLGYIAADSTGNQLNIAGGPKANSGVIAATDGGRLLVSTTTIDQTGGGFLEADGGEVTISGSTIIGGLILNSGEPGSLVSLTNTTLDAVTLNGDAQHNFGSTVSIAGGSLVNNGTFIVNPTNTFSTTTLNFPGSTIIGGSGLIRLNSSSNRARMIGAGISVENGSDHSIRGFGQIQVDLINSGLVVADFDGQALEVSAGDYINLSTMRAQNGGELRFQNMTMNQSAAGEVVADGGAVNLASSTVINGGTIRNLMTPGSSVAITGATTLDDVTIEGDWSLGFGNTLTLRGTTTNSGVLTVNPTSTSATTTVSIPDHATLNGSGVLRLNNSTNRAQIISGAGVQLTQEAGHSIRGYGQISAELVNDGSVVADVNGQAIRLNSAPKFNNNLFRAENGGELDVFSVTIDQTGGGTTEADGGSLIYSSSTVIGGSILNTGASGSLVSFNNSSLDAATMNGDSEIRFSSSLFVLGGSLTNNGVLTVNPTVTSATTQLSAAGNNTIIDGVGEIVLNNTTTRAQLVNSAGNLLTLGSGQTLSGIGRIAAETHIDGTLSPGLGVGTITATRPVSISASGGMLCEFNDSGQSDKFTSTSSVALSGTLEVSFVGGYTASTPEAFEIITATGGVTGRFDQVVGNAPPAPLITRVIYEPTRVRVGFTCIGDANLDGATDLNDLNIILTNFGTNSSLGDLNDDGVVDLNDLNIVLTSFGAPCP